MKPRGIGKAFSSAKAEVKKLSKISLQQAQELAFLDPDFMLRKELRHVRLMLELQKPEILLRDERIESTIVIFGSARILDPTSAKLEVAAIKQKLKTSPNNSRLKNDLKLAEKKLEKSFYYNEARKLAKIVSSACQRDKQRHFVIITGGGPGIMEAANRGAHDAKAKSIGLNIILPLEQNPNPYISPELSFQFHYFAMRKMHFLIRARVLIAFPGGYGTLDELFEALTLLQTKKIKPMPVLLFGRDYWTHVINFDYLVDEGMISREDLDLFQFVETAEEAWNVIARFYQLSIDQMCPIDSQGLQKTT